MQITNVGLAIVKAFEGCLKPVPGKAGTFKPYVCPAGVLTIGWGHTNHHEPKFNSSVEWSQAECDRVLRLDMGGFERHVAKIVPEVVVPHRFDALVSWAYNTGGPASSAVWAYARKGDVAETRIRLSRWNKANGQVLAGLTRRRESEADLFEGKIDEALRTAGAIRPATGPMPQRVDRPTVPAADVAKQTKGVITAAAAGGAAAGGGAASKTVTVQPDTPKPEPKSMSASSWAIALGVVVFVVAIIFIVRKRNEMNADYA